MVEVVGCCYFCHLCMRNLAGKEAGCCNMKQFLVNVWCALVNIWVLV